MKPPAASISATPSTDRGSTIRVALVSDWFLPRLGGIELYLGDLSTRLQASIADVEVLTPVPGPQWVNGVHVQRLCVGDRPDGGYRFPPPLHANNSQDALHLLDLFFGRRRPGALQKLRQVLTDGGYDVVHVHLGNTPFAYLAIRTCLALGLPVVATFHSVLGKMERPVAALCGRLLGCRSWPSRIHLTAVSSTAAEARSAMFGPVPFAILPNAADSAWADDIRVIRARRREPGPERPLQIVSVMRLHPRKRPLALIDAFAAAAREVSPERAPRLRIAGDGPLRSAMLHRTAALDIADRVELCGQLSRQELAALLADADLFAMPSRLESFGIAALEARLAGVPVLAMQRSGARDFLRDHEDSLLVAGDDAFASAISRFANDPELREKLAAGSRRPLSGYSWDDLARRCGEAYAQAIALRAAG